MIKKILPQKMTSCIKEKFSSCKIVSCVKTKISSRVLLYVAIFILGAFSPYIFKLVFAKNSVAVKISYFERDKGVIIAKVNDFPIYLEDVNMQLGKISKGVTFDQLQPEGKKLVLEEIAAQTLINQAIIKDGFNKIDEETKNLLIIKLQQGYLKKVVNKSIKDEVVKTKYAQLVMELKGKKDLKISHIVLKSEFEALSVTKELEKISFEEAAKRYSLDKKTAADSGNLGYIPENIMTEEFKNNVLKLGVGQVSRPFKTEAGWHIVKLFEKRPAQFSKFEDVKDKVRSSLADEKIKEYVKGLVAGAKIEKIELLK